MIDDHLAEQAALYAAGALAAEERQLFELILEFDTELAAHAAGLLEAAAAVASAPLPAAISPSSRVKERVLAAVANRPQGQGVGIVVTSPDRRVQWINAAFSEMCGYTLEEVAGKSLGPILQGEKTDRSVAERMRCAVHEHRPCRETILNYHKDGTPYWVEIDIQMVFDPAGAVRWMIARERELDAPPMAA